MGRKATRSKKNQAKKRIKRALYEPYYVQQLETLGAKLDEVRGYMPREIPETPLDKATEKITPFVHQHPNAKQTQSKNENYDVSYTIDNSQPSKSKPTLSIETQFTELNPTSNPFHANNDKDSQLTSNNDNNTFEDDDDVEMGGLDSAVGKLTKKKLLKLKTQKKRLQTLKKKTRREEKALGVAQMEQ